MKLAREFARPDWRNMLAGMSSSELSEWGRFYHQQYFECDLLDSHFARLSHMFVSSMSNDTDLTPRHFSLLNPSEPENQHVSEHEMDDDMLMSVAESLPGGVRYG